MRVRSEAARLTEQAMHASKSGCPLSVRPFQRIRVTRGERKENCCETTDKGGRDTLLREILRLHVSTHGQGKPKLRMGERGGAERTQRHGLTVTQDSR